MKIEEFETRIVGNWIFNGQKMFADDRCSRIERLIRCHLQLISTEESGWQKLYQDPDDKRYWQLRFDHSEMHGGGPPSLIMLSETEVKNLYAF